MIKSERWIRQMSETHGLIEPFVDKQVQKGVICPRDDRY
jgi:deoxycytidine triphosphate deaminase